MISTCQHALSKLAAGAYSYACRESTGTDSTIRKSIILNDSYGKVLSKILSIVAGLAKGDTNIDENTVLQADVGLTSLQVMELVLEVEEEFDISFPLNRLPDIQTVKELAEAIVAVLDQ